MVPAAVAEECTAFLGALQSPRESICLPGLGMQIHPPMSPLLSAMTGLLLILI